MDVVVVLALVGVAAAVGPVAPVGLGVLERLLRVDGLRRRLVGGEPGQHERHPLAFRDRERRHGVEVLAAQRHRGAQAERVRPGGEDEEDKDDDHDSDTTKSESQVIRLFQIMKIKQNTSQRHYE